MTFVESVAAKTHGANHEYDPAVNRVSCHFYARKMVSLIRTGQKNKCDHRVIGRAEIMDEGLAP